MKMKQFHIAYKRYNKTSYQVLIYTLYPLYNSGYYPEDYGKFKKVDLVTVKIMKSGSSMLVL